MLQAVDKATDKFGRDLSKVLGELEKNVTDILAGTLRGKEELYDVTALLNSRGEMLKALRDAGYNDLASDHIANYPDIVQAVKKDLRGRDKIPPIQLSTATADTFKQIALADLEAFSVIGNKAMDDLRLELYRGALSNKPFSDMVDVIRASTVGFDKKGSPLSNYAYTYANTATLNFGQEVVREVGEELGVKLWEVVGPLDDVTRQICRDALADPIRTEQEWKNAGYWSDRGSWNCRHLIYPYFG